MPEDIKEPDDITLLDIDSQTSINTKFNYNRQLSIAMDRVSMGFFIQELGSVENNIDVLDVLLSPYSEKDTRFLKDYNQLKEDIDKQINKLRPDFSNDDVDEMTKLRWARCKKLFSILLKVMRRSNLLPNEDLTEEI